MVILGDKPDLAILFRGACNGFPLSSFNCTWYMVPESILWFHVVLLGGLLVAVHDFVQSKARTS